MISKILALAFVLLTTTSGWAKTAVAVETSSPVVAAQPGDNIYKYCPTAGDFVLVSKTATRELADSATNVRSGTAVLESKSSGN